MKTKKPIQLALAAVSLFVFFALFSRFFDAKWAFGYGYCYGYGYGYCSQNRQVSKPTASPVGGVYNIDKTITLSTETTGADIFYTTDGSDPTASGIRYVQSISISSNTTIKAIAYMDGLQPSEVMSENYIIDKNVVVTQISQNKILSDAQAGIFSADGGNISATPKVIFNANYIVQSDSATVSISQDTEVRERNGNVINFTQLQNTPIAVSGMAGAVKFGLEGVSLIFSKDITINLTVGTKYNKNNLQVYYSENGSDNWQKQTTCFVQNGICSFQSNHATSFAAKKKSSSSNKKDDEIKKKRSIKNSSSKVSRNEILVQTGRRFSKNSSVLLYFSKQGGGYYKPMTVATNKSGFFSVQYKVDKPNGVYNWYAVDSKTGKKSKTIKYRVR